MTEVVSAAPWFAWGWQMLVDWVEEDRGWERLHEQDGAWESAWRLLQQVPPQMLTDAAFRRRRLLMLRKAGVERSQVEAQWTELRRDFPDDPTILAGLPRARTGRRRRTCGPASRGRAHPLVGLVGDHVGGDTTVEVPVQFVTPAPCSVR